RLARAAGALEQREILHVARADLDDVSILFHKVERFVVDGLGDDAETILIAHLGQDFEAWFSEPLKAVRRSAGFIGASAEQAYPRGFELARDLKALRCAFNRAGPRDERKVRSSDPYFAGRGGDLNDRVFFLGVAADQFVRFADRNAFDHARHGFKNAQVECAVVAGDADGGASGTGDGVSL